MPSIWIRGARALRLLIATFFAAYNLIPLYGVWAWQWDAFQILILYWSESVLLVGWTLLRLRFVPPNLLGTITLNGKLAPASYTSLIGLMALAAGGFCAAHLFFLCAIFSGDWFSRLDGFGDFLHTFYIASGAWVALLLVTVVGGIEALTGEYHPLFVDALARRLGIARRGLATPAAAKPDAVNDLISPIFGQILVMQVAIIGGAWMARSFGSLAPLTIVIGGKTLADFSRRR